MLQRLEMTSESVFTFTEADIKPHLYNEGSNYLQDAVLSSEQHSSICPGLRLPDPPIEIKEQNIKIKHLQLLQNRLIKKNLKSIDEAVAALKNVRSNKWRVNLATKINKVRIKKKVKETTKLVEEIDMYNNERKRMTAVLRELPRQIAADKENIQNSLMLSNVQCFYVLCELGERAKVIEKKLNERFRIFGKSSLRKELSENTARQSSLKAAMKKIGELMEEVAKYEFPNFKAEI